MGRPSGAPRHDAGRGPDRRRDPGAPGAHRLPRLQDHSPRAGARRYSDPSIPAAARLQAGQEAANACQRQPDARKKSGCTVRIDRTTPKSPSRDEQGEFRHFVQDTTVRARSRATPPGRAAPPPAPVKSGGTQDDLTDGISFDRYNGDSTLVNRIAFLPSGGIAPPEDSSNSALPTTAGGRGIYFADYFGKNYFRVTVDSDLSGHLRVDKLVAGTGYTPTGWVWR